MSLSSEDFERLQQQLISLRDSNYKIQDKAHAQENELQRLRHQVSQLEKDLNKANKIISKSKRSKDVESLFDQNQLLEQKLVAQEEDFRLQNHTLMQELNKVVNQNEEYRLEIVGLQKKYVNSDPDAAEQEDVSSSDLLRLQAENFALKKRLEIVQQSNNESSTIEDDSTSTDTDLNVNSENLDNSAQVPSQHTRDLELLLDTERAETAILRQRLEEVQGAKNQEAHSLNEEIEAIKEKLKKKQESFLALQEEKEQLYATSRLELQNLEAGKNEQINTLNRQLSSVNEAFQTLQASSATDAENSAKTIKSLKEMNTSLEQRASSADAEAVQRLENKCGSLEQQLADKKDELDKLLQERQDLELQIKELRNTMESSLAELNDARQERDSHITSLQEATKLAESRKNLLDELAIKYQEQAEKQRKEKQDSQKAFDEELSILTSKLQNEQTKSKKLSTAMNDLEDMKSQLKGSEEKNAWMERKLKEVEEELEQVRTDFELKIETMQTEHQSGISQLNDQHSIEIEKLQSAVAAETTKNESLQAEIEKMRQRVKDSASDQKLHEKKGSAMLKDLKRQLLVERKRADSLQQRFQEVFTDDSRDRGDLSMESVDKSTAKSFDTSSVSSWSTSGIGMRETNKFSSHLYPPGEASSHSGESDSPIGPNETELVMRITSLQEEKCLLEEKVRHLEENNSVMADDILDKQSIINYYCMEHSGKDRLSSSSHKLSLKKVVDFVKDAGTDENLKDINRRLQRMLEETLTKNMHLQEDMATLSSSLQSSNGYSG